MLIYFRRLMKKRLKTLYVLITSVVITIINLPFALAKTASRSRIFSPASSNHTPSIKGSVFNSRSVYDSLHLNFTGLSRQAYDHAKRGLELLKAQGKIINDSILTIIDFSLPSSKKRLFVIDTKHFKVLHHSLVAHGRNSGAAMANSFSNTPESFKSSPGFFITGNTYLGHNGYSLKLQGIERGINDNAYARAIVMHGAPYVSQSIVQLRGYAGRSEGCPAVPVELAKPIINTIKDGTCLFIYTPLTNYQSTL